MSKDNELVASMIDLVPRSRKQKVIVEHYKLEPALRAPGKFSWIASHNGCPPAARSFQAGHERLRIGVAKVLVTKLIGASSVFSRPEREFGRNVLRTSNEKQRRLLLSRRDAELRTPRVMFCMSKPLNEFTLPVLPPTLQVMLVSGPTVGSMRESRTFQAQGASSPS